MISIRSATAQDIPLIQAIAHATWPVSYREMISPEQIAYMLELMYSEDSLRKQMGAKGHRFIIAELSGAAVGFAGFEHHHEDSTRTRLHKLYVQPGTQGGGAGKALLLDVIEEAMGSGDTEVDLTVNKRNRSLGFYKAHGFAIERDIVMDIGGGYVMDDHIMVKALS
ncbi:MAG: GNAT family N-acetyltransferase [Flavobacteriales bacterium]|nr:GNAT family N-acetyltransferase [Flavobacteriales bacterium]